VDTDTTLRRFDATPLTVSDLFSAYGAILAELRRREIVRSSNNPLSDYAELLFCRAFGWSRTANSAVGHDAIENSGIRYQVKGRRLTRHNSSREVGAIRELDQMPFDYLAGLLVDEHFLVVRAALVPVAVVQERAAYVPRTNAWKFLLLDGVWALPGVVDTTDELRTAALAI